MSPQYGELRPTSGWDRLTSLGYSCKFQLVSRLRSVTARHLVVGVSQTLRRWTEGATYIRQGDHQVGHWPTFLVLYTFRRLSMHYVTVLLCAWIVTWAASCTSCHIHNLTRLQMCFYNSPSSLTTGITWFNPGCTGGPCGAIGTHDYGGVYSKPQCHRKSCVPCWSLWLIWTMPCIFHNGWLSRV